MSSILVLMSSDLPGMKFGFVDFVGPESILVLMSSDLPDMKFGFVDFGGPGSILVLMSSDLPGMKFGFVDFQRISSKRYSETFAVSLFYFFWSKPSRFHIFSLTA